MILTKPVRKRLARSISILRSAGLLVKVVTIPGNKIRMNL